MWCAVDHSELPTGSIDCAVVEPTQQDSVIGMGGATVFRWIDVVDFAPGGRDVASGNTALPVTQADGPSLLWGEAALGGSKFNDATVVVKNDLLGATRAGVLLDDPHRYGYF